jgi:hypothetical protein
VSPSAAIEAARARMQAARAAARANINQEALKA